MDEREREKLVFLSTILVTHMWVGSHSEMCNFWFLSKTIKRIIQPQFVLVPNILLSTVSHAAYCKGHQKPAVRVIILINVCFIPFPFFTAKHAVVVVQDVVLVVVIAPALANAFCLVVIYRWYAVIGIVNACFALPIACFHKLSLARVTKLVPSPWLAFGYACIVIFRARKGFRKASLWCLFETQRIQLSGHIRTM